MQVTSAFFIRPAYKNFGDLQAKMTKIFILKNILRIIPFNLFS